MCACMMRSAWQAISAGLLHSCGTTTSGEGLCWGDSGNHGITTVPSGKTWAVTTRCPLPPGLPSLPPLLALYLTPQPQLLLAANPDPDPDPDPNLQPSSTMPAPGPYPNTKPCTTLNSNPDLFALTSRPNLTRPLTVLLTST